MVGIRPLSEEFGKLPVFADETGRALLPEVGPRPRRPDAPARSSCYQ